MSTSEVILVPEQAGSGSTSPRARRRDLTGPLREVHLARADLRRLRNAGPQPAREAQARYVEALSHYIGELEELRLPVPRALRDDLRIFRNVLNSHR